MSAADARVRERYIRIYCEKMRVKDMRWRFRAANVQPYPGTCYAQLTPDGWRCCCCGDPVHVAW